MQQPRIGVIGGSGIYEIEGITDVREISLTTPFGDPSDAYVVGVLDDTPVAFLSRHGRGHRFNPSEVPYRANVMGFRMLGVERLISVAAVGSLREDVRPLDMMVPDQFVDRTRGRTSTFFGDGIVAHVAFADPVCPVLGGALAAASESAGNRTHPEGTYICIEGPQFSTRAESNLYRTWGCDIIGMTNVTEAKLAREAELCYATLAMVCDYDCWHETHEDVSAEMVLEVLWKCVANAKSVVAGAVRDLHAVEATCDCRSALRRAVLTDPARVPGDVRNRLAVLLDKYEGADS